MGIAQQIQLELALRLVALPLFVLWFLNRINRRDTSTPVPSLLSAVGCATIVFVVLGTPLIRIGVHTEDLVLACLFAPLLLHHRRSPRQTMLGALACTTLLVIWILWPRLSAGLSLLEHVKLDQVALWLSAVIALWAVCHHTWEEHPRLLVIGAMIFLTILVSFKAGSARSMQVAGALGVVCAGAGVVTLRHRGPSSWSLQAPLSLAVVGLLLYQTEYGDVPRQNALLIFALPLVGVAGALRGLGFGPMVILTGTLTLITLPVILGESEEQEPTVYDVGSIENDDDLPAPPEAKSQFEGGYE